MDLSSEQFKLNMSNVSEDGDIYSSQGSSPFSGLTGSIFTISIKFISNKIWTFSLGAYKPFSSPYLNYDPGYLNQAQPEFIFLDGASKQRGRMELAFGQIGGSCMIGAAIGGATGFYNGLRATTLAGQTGKLRRTQLVEYVHVKNAGLVIFMKVISQIKNDFPLAPNFTFLIVDLQSLNDLRIFP